MTTTSTQSHGTDQGRKVARLDRGDGLLKPSAAKPSDGTLSSGVQLTSPAPRLLILD